MRFTSYLTSFGLLASFVAAAPAPASHEASSKLSRRCEDDPNTSDGSSSIPVGSWIYSCTVPGQVALTFDDGPVFRTGSVLDQLQAAGMKATFFVNGLNWGDINSEQSKALVRRMVNEGHQVGSHTYVFYLLHSVSQPLSLVLQKMKRCEDLTSS